jgi:hypothetical protein
MRLQGLAGEPLANVQYVYGSDLQDDETPGSAPTASDGWLEERVPMSARALKLRLTERPQALTLRFGHLDPIRDEDSGEPIASGVDARLRALGYDVPSSSKGKDALATFQALALSEKEPTGEPDARTLQALAEAASCEAPIEGAGAQCGDDAFTEMSTTLVALRIGALAGPCDAWRFEAVPEGAFVIVRPEHTALQLRGVTQGDRGEIYQFCGDDKASRTPSQPLYLFAPGRYFVWWTFNEEAFAQALENPASVQNLENVIEVKQFHATEEAPLRSELERFGMRDDVVHTVCEHILQRHPFYEGRSSPIFDVTPLPIRALCTVEVMQWYARMSNEASGSDLATLAHASTMIEAAEKGLPDLTLEREAQALFPTVEARRVFEYFRDYAWRCAATGVLRTNFRLSIRMHEGPSDHPQGGMPKQPDDAGLDAGVPMEQVEDWLAAAKNILEATRKVKHGPAVHPYFQGVQGPLRALMREGVTLSVEQQALLLSYYDSYLFGAALRTSTVDCGEDVAGPSTYRSRMTGRMREWSQQHDVLREQAHRLLAQHADAERFVVAYSDAYPYDETLLDRYESAASFAGFEWWTSLRASELRAAPPQDSDGTFRTAAWPYWKAFKARIKPFAESAKGSGKLCKLLGERVAAHKFARTKAEQMLDTVGRLELTLAGADVDATIHVLRTEDAVVSLEPTGEAGEVRVALQGKRAAGAPSHVTLRFVKVTHQSDPSGVPAPPSGDHGAKTHAAHLPAQRAWQLKVTRREYLDEMARYSKPFSVLGDTLNLAIAVATIADGEAKGKDQLMATFDVTKGLVGVVEGLPGALTVLAPSAWMGSAKKTAEGLKGVSTWLGRIDHFNKIYKGLSILCSSESVVDYELRHGRAFRAEVQRFNDIANVVLGAASAADLVGTAAVSLGAAEFLGWSPALLAGFGATPWGLVLSVGGGLIVAGSALLLDLTQAWDKRLMAIEEQLDAACRAEIRGDRFLVSTRMDALRTALDAVWLPRAG